GRLPGHGGHEGNTAGVVFERRVVQAAGEGHAHARIIGPPVRCAHACAHPRDAVGPKSLQHTRLTLQAPPGPWETDRRQHRHESRRTAAAVHTVPVTQYPVRSPDGTVLAAWRNDAAGIPLLICNGLASSPAAWPSLRDPDCGFDARTW